MRDWRLLLYLSGYSWVNAILGNNSPRFRQKCQFYEQYTQTNAMRPRHVVVVQTSEQRSRHTGCDGVTGPLLLP